MAGSRACHGPRSGPAPRAGCGDGAGEGVPFSLWGGALDGGASDPRDGADLLLRGAPCPGWVRIPYGIWDNPAGDQGGVSTS